MKSNRQYTISISPDLASADPDAGWEGTLSVDRVVDAALVEAFRRTKLAPPRPEIRVHEGLEPSQVELSTRDGLKAVFDVPGPGEIWRLDHDEVAGNVSSLLFGLQGRVEPGDSKDSEFRADREGLFGLLAHHLITARGLAVADTGTLARLADTSLGHRKSTGSDPTPQAQALALWARSMFIIGVPDLSIVELLDVGISVAAHEAEDADAREAAVLAGTERLAAGWTRLVGYQDLPLFEVSAELCAQLSSKEPGERNRARTALRGQLALIMLRLPDALHRPGLLAVQQGAEEQATWNLLNHPELVGLPKTSMAMADFSEVSHLRQCVLGAPKSARAEAA